MRANVFAVGECVKGETMKMGSKGERILVVDDEPYICSLVSRWLEEDGYSCLAASGVYEALETLGSEDISLVLADILMPEMSGMELLSKIRGDFGERVAVIMLTGVDSHETAIQALELGAYGYMAKPLKKNEVKINVASGLERRRLTVEGKDHERRLEGQVRARTLDVRKREAEIVLRLISASEYRDDETGAHIRRIGLYSAVLAEAAGWKPEAAGIIRLAGAMHDVGKIGVPDNILLKPAKLTDEEFEVVKRHTEIGARILGGSEIPLLRMAHEIALSHHEWWDGSGYPQGLAGGAIPESARIVAIADVYDALTSHRVYRPALPEDEAIRIMSKEKGSHFEPRLFELFMSMLPEFHRVRSIQDYIELHAPRGEETPVSENVAFKQDFSLVRGVAGGSGAIEAAGRFFHHDAEGNVVGIAPQAMRAAAAHAFLERGVIYV